MKMQPTIDGRNLTNRKDLAENDQNEACAAIAEGKACAANDRPISMHALAQLIANRKRGEKRTPESARFQALVKLHALCDNATFREGFRKHIGEHQFTLLCERVREARSSIALKTEV
jgi:hypothetical protein